jgi:hypothetical protein
MKNNRDRQAKSFIAMWAIIGLAEVENEKGSVKMDGETSLPNSQLHEYSL